jgi:hypothetical protein
MGTSDNVEQHVDGEGSRGFFEEKEQRKREGFHEKREVKLDREGKIHRVFDEDEDSQEREVSLARK